MTNHEDLMSWERVDTRAGPDLDIFSVRFDFYKDPRSTREIRRVVLESRDWCSIVALTPDCQVVLVRQFRFGVMAATLEIPGGSVGLDEHHLDAAKRELFEEAGFEAGDWEYLGSSLPNSAFHNNRVHHWLAKNAVRVAGPANSAHEYTEVTIYPAREIPALVHGGKLEHSLGLVALSRVIDLRLPSMGDWGDS